MRASARVLQELLFLRTGRLALNFENELERLVGRSQNLAAVLEKLAEGPMRLVDLARALGAQSGQTSAAWSGWGMRFRSEAKATTFVRLEFCTFRAEALHRIASRRSRRLRGENTRAARLVSASP